MAGTFSHLVSRDTSFGEPLQHLSHGARALLIFVSVICFLACFLVRIFEIPLLAAPKKKKEVVEF